MKISIYLIISIICLTISAKEYTIDDCINIAIENNDDIVNQNYDNKNSIINYKQSKLNLLPSINGNNAESWSLGRSLTYDNTYKSVNSFRSSFGLSGDINLFNGFQDVRNIKINRLKCDVNNYSKDVIIRNISIDICQLYFQVLIDDKMYAFFKEQIAISKEKLEKVKLLLENDRIVESDLFDIEAKIAKEESLLQEIKNNLKMSMLNLCQYMNVKYDDEIILNNVELQTLNIPKLDVFNEDEFPEIRSMNLLQKVNSYSLKNYESRYLPIINANVSTGSKYYDVSSINSLSFKDQMNNYLSSGITINVSIPIFNRFKTRSDVRSFKLNIKKMDVEINKKKKELRKSVIKCFYSVQNAYKKMLSSKKYYNAVKKSFEFSDKKYDVGKLSIYELYDIKDNLYEAKSDYIKSKYDYIFRTKVLKYYFY